MIFCRTHSLLNGVSQRLDLGARWRLPQLDVVGDVVIFDRRLARGIARRLTPLRFEGVFASIPLVLIVDVFVDLVEGALVVQQLVMNLGPDLATDDDVRRADKKHVEKFKIEMFNPLPNIYLEPHALMYVFSYGSLSGTIAKYMEYV